MVEKNHLAFKGIRLNSEGQSSDGKLADFLSKNPALVREAFPLYAMYSDATRAVNQMLEQTRKEYRFALRPYPDPEYPYLAATYLGENGNSSVWTYVPDDCAPLTDPPTDDIQQYSLQRGFCLLHEDVICSLDYPDSESKQAIHHLRKDAETITRILTGFTETIANRPLHPDPSKEKVDAALQAVSCLDEDYKEMTGQDGHIGGSYYLHTMKGIRGSSDVVGTPEISLCFMLKTRIHLDEHIFNLKPKDITPFHLIDRYANLNKKYLDAPAWKPIKDLWSYEKEKEQSRVDALSEEKAHPSDKHLDFAKDAVLKLQ